jgi:hypothetical protein
MASSGIWAALAALAAGAMLWRLCRPQRKEDGRSGETGIPSQLRLQPARVTKANTRPSGTASRRPSAGWR